ncbi:Protein of unknown function (DUF1365) [Geosmithia morbida]|uniref:Uncharacterized protein n=1 Tax=Geosmithia morbida TaxID=1094350 RepID=A0A9P4Z333_9HYPO|nr:Protein of unknown function (DUF1365) [Geosmithia morbida]KAF4125744.1 Protein of unknown function (DUF1365) [Geosmithia morbida]
MDGISDDSPLATLLWVWDCVETLLERYPRLPVDFCVLSTYLFLFDGALKTALNSLALFGWLKLAPFRLIRAAHQGIFAVVVGAALWSTRFFSPRSRSDECRGAPGWSALSYLIPCCVTQTRLLPKRHSFSHPHLLVGIPVGIKGVVNGVISVEEPGPRSAVPYFLSSSKAWYDVDSADHLDGGAGGLRHKLDGHLKSQGADPEDYPYAYLVTTARSMGYHFSPVSFWYLYSPDKTLSAMVVEMNNLFGERRAYVLTRDGAANRLTAARPQEARRPDIFNASWKKDFHVSPFNSRKGSYTLLATDPLEPDLEGFRGIDATITLVSSKGQTKVVAKVSSSGEAIDASSMNLSQKLCFLSSWWLNGFLTLPRLVKEYAVLYFKHDLHIWYRPEPLKDTWARNASATEMVLESVFRDYLGFLVESSPMPLVVVYIPSRIPGHGEQVFQSPSAAGERAPEAEKVRIKVLTPSFYSRFVSYAHDMEAIFCEMTESCTIWVDKPDVLPKIFIKRPTPPVNTHRLGEFLMFKAIHSLRRRPPSIKRPMTSAEHPAPTPRVVDIRDFRISSMDGFVLNHMASSDRAAYSSAVIRQFLADRLLGGYASVLEAGGTLCRLAVVWAAATMLANIATGLNLI